MSDQKTLALTFDDTSSLTAISGDQGTHLRLIERRLGVSIAVRGNQVSVSGQSFAAELAKQILEQLYQLARRGHPLFSQDINSAIQVLSKDRNASLAKVLGDRIFTRQDGRSITPRSLNQKIYVEAIRSTDIVFGIGPAGTGKTYLAMAMAVNSLLKKQVKRIILTRPAVEAGERLGFLPGDLIAKVNPYLRPLYDALYDMMDAERVERLIEKNVIEVAPLAFMRGRTLNDAFVILDEAQNATIAQMRMFLTRLGFESKAVVTGDVTQVDLTDRQRSGLQHAASILGGIDGIGICRFTDQDVVRHRLVQRVIQAYERDDRQAQRSDK